MTAGVVTVGRHRYAVGLYWENSPAGGRVAQIAKEAAKQPGQQADYFAVRPGNKDGRIAQFGLFASDPGQTISNLPVLAACLANQIPGAWAGAFRLNEGIVVVIVRDDLIVPDGDLFFADESEARDRILQEVSFGGLQTTYAPESWSIPGADNIPLTLLLSGRKDIQLQRVNVARNTKIVTAAGIAAFLVILGAVWYWQQKADEENVMRVQQQEEAMRRAQFAAKKLLPTSMQEQPVPEPVYDRKWEKIPSATAVINNCYEGLAKVPMVVAGWKMATVRCGGNTISINWTREKGYSSPPPGLLVNETAMTAIQTVNLPAMLARGPENLLDTKEITHRYLSQNWPGSILRAPDDPLPSPPPDYKGPWNPPPAAWVKRSFTLTVPELPSYLREMIGSIPGAIINSMSYVPNGMSSSWQVEGIIYENRN